VTRPDPAKIADPVTRDPVPSLVPGPPLVITEAGFYKPDAFRHINTVKTLKGTQRIKSNYRSYPLQWPYSSLVSDGMAAAAITLVLSHINYMSLNVM